MARAPYQYPDPTHATMLIRCVLFSIHGGPTPQFPRFSPQPQQANHQSKLSSNRPAATQQTTPPAIQFVRYTANNSRDNHIEVMSSPTNTSRSSKPTLVDNMSNLAIVAAATKSTISTAASDQEDSTNSNSQETRSAPPSLTEDAQAQTEVHAKPKQLGSDETSEDSTQDTTMLDTEESGSDHSSDDEIPQDGGSDLWKSIWLKKHEVKRYEAMIEEELEGDKPGKKRHLIVLRATLAQQIEARDVSLRKQAEVDTQGRNARWGVEKMPWGAQD